jgi:hypothetical protein
MEVIGTAVNAAVVGAVGILIVWQLRGRFHALEKRIDRLEDRLDQRMDTFQISLDGLRSDVTQVALAVGARPRAGEV